MQLQSSWFINKLILYNDTTYVSSFNTFDCEYLHQGIKIMVTVSGTNLNWCFTFLPLQTCWFEFDTKTNVSSFSFCVFTTTNVSLDKVRITNFTSARGGLRCATDSNRKTKKQQHARTYCFLDSHLDILQLDVVIATIPRNNRTGFRTFRRNQSVSTHVS